MAVEKNARGFSYKKDYEREFFRFVRDCKGKWGSAYLRVLKKYGLELDNSVPAKAVTCGVLREDCLPLYLREQVLIDLRRFHIFGERL